jgi:hypothetical protein
MKSNPRLIDFALLAIWSGALVIGKVQVAVRGNELSRICAVTVSAWRTLKTEPQPIQVIDTSKENLYTVLSSRLVRR